MKRSCSTLYSQILFRLEYIVDLLEGETICMAGMDFFYASV
jgi:hypothetical protein